MGSRGLTAAVYRSCNQIFFSVVHQNIFGDKSGTQTKSRMQSM